MSATREPAPPPQGGEGGPKGRMRGSPSEAPPPAPPDGRSPMADPAHPDLVAVSFNGCIYNHRELRTELESLDHVFETDHSDTEVLIHGWREWGLSLQDHLDGMYAFLLWDRRTGQFA